MVVLVCNPSIQEVGAGGSEVQGHLSLVSKMEASLRHMKPCLTNQRNEKDRGLGLAVEGGLRKTETISMSSMHFLYSL